MTDFHHLFTVLCPSTHEGSCAVVSVAITLEDDETHYVLEILDTKIVSDAQAARDVLSVAAPANQVLDLYPVIEAQLVPDPPRRHRRTQPTPEASEP